MATARPKRTLYALACLALLAGAAPAPAQEAATQPAKQVLHVLRLSGAFADLPESGFDLGFLLGGGGEQPKPFFELIARIEEFAVQDESAHLLLDLGVESLGLNLAQLGELERAFGRARANGKSITAWLSNAAPVHYQAACLCDRILMADMGMLDLRAPAMQTMFYRDMLDLVGVKATAVRCGEFKGAVEPYVRSQMSGHLREHYREMLASFNDDMVRRISTGRKLPRVKVRQLQAQRLFSPAEAMEAGLVDGITAWDNAVRAYEKDSAREVEVRLIALKDKKLDFSNPLTLFAQIFSSPRKRSLRHDALVVLHLSGTIVDGEKDLPGSIVCGPSSRLIDQLAKDPKVKGVVLRINSPGGSATASERILLALRRLAQSKPVAVSMGELAASGGYYIACLPGATVYAQPATLTGSIGVFGLLMSAKALAGRIGIGLETVALDESGAVGSLFEEPPEVLLGWIQKMVDSTYDRFLGHVTLARRLPRQALAPLAEGRVWSGAQALRHGLVDRLGGLQDALAEVASKAGLEQGKYTVEHLPEPRNPFSLLAEGSGARVLLESLPGPLKALLGAADLGASPLLPLLGQGLEKRPAPRVWALAPMALRVQ